MSKGIKSTWIIPLIKNKASLKVSKENIMISSVVVSSNMHSNLKSVKWTGPSLLTTILKKFMVLSMLDLSKLSPDCSVINLTLITLSSLSQNSLLKSMIIL